jgi:hypothetical protein
MTPCRRQPEPVTCQKPFTLTALARAVRKVLAHAGDLAVLGTRDLSQL